MGESGDLHQKQTGTFKSTNQSTTNCNCLNFYLKDYSNILNPLPSGKVLTQITNNFINWNSTSNIVIAGHLTATYGQSNQTRMIDVTDYANNLIKAGKRTLKFVLYRPFRHPNFKTGGGNVSSDDLSFGSLVRISSATSTSPPQ